LSPQHANANRGAHRTISRRRPATATLAAVLTFVAAIPIALGLFMLGRALLLTRSPRFDGTVLELVERSMPGAKGRLFPHAVVSYRVSGEERRADVLMRGRPTPGDTVALFHPAGQPDRVQLYVVGREVAAAVVVLAIGGALLAGSLVAASMIS